MICPFCSSSVPDGSTSCPSCDGDLAHEGAESVAEFIFCEGCGARLASQDRVCPKCGRPAPGILSQRASAPDLAAGKTASFPRLTSEMIAEAIPAPVPGAFPLDGEVDPYATGVLDGADLAAAGVDRAGGSRGAGRKAVAHGDAAPATEPPSPDAYARRSRGKFIALALVVCAVLGGAFFVAVDPLGVMPGVYQSFEQSARDMFPSRQVPDEEEPGDAEQDDASNTQEAPSVSDSTLSDAEAFQQLSSIYGKIVSFQDGIGAVVETYNGQYLAKDVAQRTEASKGAYELRDNLQALIDELDGLKLADDSAYLEDVDHLRQLATWTFNRVDVLCRSWDISLALPEGERPANHQDEILAPLREVEKVNGKAVDVISYEEHVQAWKPQEK